VSFTGTRILGFSGRGVYRVLFFSANGLVKWDSFRKHSAVPEQ